MTSLLRNGKYKWYVFFSEKVGGLECYVHLYSSSLRIVVFSIILACNSLWFTALFYQWNNFRDYFDSVYSNWREPWKWRCVYFYVIVDNSFDHFRFKWWNPLFLLLLVCFHETFPLFRVKMYRFLSRYLTDSLTEFN